MIMRSSFYYVFPFLTLTVFLFSACDTFRFWEDSDAGYETVSPVQKQIMDVRNRATTIQSAIEHMNRRDLPTFQLGDTALTVTLYTENGSIRLIDERLDVRNAGNARNRYYFDRQLLFHFYGKSSRQLDVNAGTDKPSDVRSRMYFNDAGNLFYSECTIDGFDAEMPEDELPSVMQRSVALRLLEETDNDGAIDTATFIATLYNSKNTASQLIDRSGQSAFTGITEEAAADQPPADEVSIVDRPTEDGASPAPAQDSTPAVRKDERVSATGESATVTEQTASPSPDVLPAREWTSDAFAAPMSRSVAPKQAAPATGEQTEHEAPRMQATQKENAARRTERSRTQDAPGKKETPRQAKVPSPSPAGDVPPAIVLAPDDEDGYIEPHTHSMIPGKLNSRRLRFQPGSRSASLEAQVIKGQHQEYVLRARREQQMSVSLDSRNPDIFFRVFLRNGDISGQRRIWTGVLPRYGDYHVVVYLRPDVTVSGSIPFALTISIK